MSPYLLLAAGAWLRLRSLPAAPGDDTFMAGLGALSLTVVGGGAALLGTLVTGPSAGSSPSLR